MPAEYDKIRAENVARYGWDTAVLELLGQLYSERTHFIFELIQNAEDAGATDLTFTLFADRLEVRHDGRDFTVADVRGICGVGQGTKADDLTQIGEFGIGFKAVYAYTNSPRIHSGAENFRIEKYVRPYAVDPLGEPAAADRLRVPFRPPRSPRGCRRPGDLRGAWQHRCRDAAVPAQHRAGPQLRTGDGGRRDGTDVSRARPLRPARLAVQRAAARPWRRGMVRLGTAA